MSNISINNKCIGCRQCIPACPFGAIKLEGKKATVLENCTLCGACISFCKFEAIEFEKEISANLLDVSAFKGVWIFCEQKNNEIASVSLELLGAGRKLADQLGTELSAILPCCGIGQEADRLFAYGADNVYIVDHPALKCFNDEIYTDIFVQLVKDYMPEILLFGATAYGRSLAPRIASRLNTGLTADCTELSIDPEKRILLQTRPAFGGNLMATIICPDRRPQMSTVRPKVMKALEPDYSRTGKVIIPELKVIENSRTKVLEVVSSVCEKVNLAEAEIIVSGGRGIISPGNFYLLEELARVLGGAVGASRAAVDAGWIDYSHQVGQTGKTVGPRVYFACGISGAIQHIAGMSSSDIIIAINRNPEAPIFKIANFGIVGDVLEVIPALIEEFKARL